MIIVDKKFDSSRFSEYLNVYKTIKLKCDTIVFGDCDTGIVIVQGIYHWLW